MADREKVMRGLECCALSSLGDCDVCPYTEIRCSDHLCGDALALLREQEPRVMTLDEIYDCTEGDCLYYQCKGFYDSNVLYISSDAGFYVDLRAAIHRFTCDPNLYGSVWRCWTSRPSPEHMANTPWDVSPEVRKKWKLDDEIAGGVGQTFSPD